MRLRMPILLMAALLLAACRAAENPLAVESEAAIAKATGQSSVTQTSGAADPATSPAAEGGSATAWPEPSEIATLNAANTAPPTRLPAASATAQPSPPPAVTATRTRQPTLQPTVVPSNTPTPLLPDSALFAWSPVVGGLAKPLDIQHAGDGRLFIVEQAGRIRLLSADGTLRTTPFLDIRARVNDSGNERGLLGLAFAPDYAASGLFYVNYTGAGGATIISRFRVSGDPNRADADSEEVLLTIEQPYSNHNGGGMAFGPDGKLYIGTGDGGSAGDPQGNGQRLDTLLGKLLRIGVASAPGYSIPTDNPYAAAGGRPEIWALGLRNPWRFSFDRLNGDLYIADVGQNAWEEVSYQPAGAAGGRNYGWNLREGAHAYAAGTAPGLIDPVAEYAHEFGCSISGGYVVRDPALPEFKGVYLYGDFCSGRIWGLVRDGQGNWINKQLFDDNFNITSFGQGADGRIYVADRSGGIYRLERK